MKKGVLSFFVFAAFLFGASLVFAEEVSFPPEGLSRCSSGGFIEEVGQVEVTKELRGDQVVTVVTLTNGSELIAKFDLVNLRVQQTLLSEYVGELALRTPVDPFQGAFSLMVIPFNSLAQNAPYVHFRNSDGTYRSNSFNLRCE